MTEKAYPLGVALREAGERKQLGVREVARLFLSEVFGLSHTFSEFIQMPLVLANRQWMRSAKAWRLFFSLPADNPLLPSFLTALIDRQVRAELNQLVLDPVLVVDVPPKGRGFQLVIETCYEQQNVHGPRLTAMVGEAVFVTLSPAGQPVETPVTEVRPEITEERKRLLTGLHVLFQNPRFQEFIGSMAGLEIRDENECKAVFKNRLCQVESCKDLSDEVIHDWRRQFNEWLNGGRNAVA